MFKVIDGKNVRFENMTFVGGAAAIQSYGASVVTTKDITIKGTQFGGISVNADTAGKLDIKGTLTYDATNTTKAVIWLDTSATDAGVTGYADVNLVTQLKPGSTTELWYVAPTTACVTTQA